MTRPGTGEPVGTRCTVPTQHASSYLQRLCKHFAHKVPAEHDTVRGHAALPGGRAEFAASDDRLEIVIHGTDTVGLERACGIVEDHLLRYAFREDLGPLDWERIEP